LTDLFDDDLGFGKIHYSDVDFDIYETTAWANPTVNCKLFHGNRANF